MIRFFVEMKPIVVSTLIYSIIVKYSLNVKI